MSSVTLVTVAFLVVALLVATGVLVAVALPRLRGGERLDDDLGPGRGRVRASAVREDSRYRSRTQS